MPIIKLKVSGQKKTSPHNVFANALAYLKRLLLYRLASLFIHKELCSILISKGLEIF
ncbi:hypothetical protein SAMN05428988_6188 [Chitinophaga sp. YR573]|nr:hypothetical protein SAMN05428988_6188 [Chitinophaga sp. YR573]